MLEITVKMFLSATISKYNILFI